ncbi:MAG: insulinase family protein, partial [Flavobacteriales bacterium]
CGDNNNDTSVSPYHYESFENDPMGVRIYTLENGLKVYLTVNKDKPRVQTAIAVRAGSKNDPSDCTGLAHYLEHMMFKGTSKVASLNWEKEKELLQQISDLFEQHKSTEDTAQKNRIYIKIDSLSQLAATYCAPNEYDKMMSSLGAKGTNAFTSVEQTVYINNIPTNELDKWLKLESERFSELVLRLFHTELETVYEEFNRGQDNDYSKVYKTLDSLMFRKHPYGRSTIGFGEHLKNPSMVRIHDFFNTYYVPNNMAVIIAGDIDPDSTITAIDKYFGKLKPGKVPEFTPPVEDPITEPITAEVYGPMAEWITMGYRFSGIHGDDWPYLRLISDLIYNGQAGLIDLNLLQEQKVLEASAYYDENNDYSQFVLRGKARQGQSLDEVKALLLEQIDHIKKGEFDDWMLKAVIKNYKLDQERWNERNFSRAMQLMGAFIYGVKWDEVLHEIDKMEAITKEQLVEWAGRHFKDNYIAVYKRNGQDKNTYKVKKPHITPIEVNREENSAYYKMFDSIQPARLKPVFIDYEKDIQKMELGGGIPFNYIENKTNHVFSLIYMLDMGTSNDDKMRMAVNYLPYLGAGDLSAEDLQKEFYKLALDFGVSASDDRTYVYMSGLEESLPQGLKLLEKLLNEPRADSLALTELVSDVVKEREDDKKNKWTILYSGLYNYARYGANSPFTDRLSVEEMKQLDPNELVEKIKSINGYKHRIFYYGQNDPTRVVELLTAEHKTPDELQEYPEAKKYEELDILDN